MPVALPRHWRLPLLWLLIIAALAAGIGLRHLELGRNVAMYRSSIATRPSGRLAGPTVVSMRPLKAAEAIRAI